MVLRINRKNLKNSIVTSLLIANTLLGAYAFFYIGTYAVTIFIIIAAIILAFGILKIGEIKASVKRNPYAVIMLTYLLINFVFTGMKSVTALVLACSFFVFYILSYRKIDQKIIQKNVILFQKIMTILALYGIYQFAGRIIGLPFADLIIDGHMVEGYNWTNLTTFMGLGVLRSNSIFLEPSLFSQFLALNILLYLQKFLEIKKDGIVKLVFLIIINVTALICTFSGTGLLILGVGILVQFLKNSKNKRRLKRYLKVSAVGIIILIAASIFFDLSSAFNYFFERFKEILYLTENKQSGYLRFTGAFQILIMGLTKFPMFGCGIGNIRELTSGLQAVVVEANGYVANGIVRIGSELGIIGLFIWILFMLRCFKNTARQNNIMWVFMITIIVMNITQEAFSSNYFWSLMLFSNILIEKEESL